MKKYLLILLAVVTLASCEKESDTLERTGVKPSITSVKFSKATVGSVSRVKVDLVLDVPEKGSLIRVDCIRGVQRINNVLTQMESGPSSFTDNSAEWPSGGTPAYYAFILNLKDGSTVTTDPYEVK